MPGPRKQTNAAITAFRRMVLDVDVCTLYPTPASTSMLLSGMEEGRERTAKRLEQVRGANGWTLRVTDSSTFELFFMAVCLCSSRAFLSSGFQRLQPLRWSKPRPCASGGVAVGFRLNQGIHRMETASASLNVPEQEAGRQAAELLTDLKISSSDSLLRTELYPAIEPHRSGLLKVSDLHTLYWEESGNAGGEPVVFLHGGPGAGTSGSNRRFFDPEWYRIILFDQRGAGKSTPHACVEENTTWDLVSDIEKIREHLGVEKWKVFGGSWGSTLALTYAQTHPDRVTGIVLRGIFLLRKKEIDWFYQSGCSAIFPDAWEPYRDHIPEEERHDFLTAYNKRLFSTDPEVQLGAAKAWTNWEMATSYLVPNEESLKRGENDTFALAFARVENHYFSRKGFFSEDSYILKHIDKIRHIPGVIVQGRYDVVCPMMSAWELHKAWPEAVFKVVTTAGHSANEQGISAELVAATEHFKFLSQKSL